MRTRLNQNKWCVLVTKGGFEIPHPFEFAKGLVDEWNMYLSGDVWNYVIEDENGETIDSLCGMYGFEYAKETALEAVPDEKGPVSTGA